MFNSKLDLPKKWYVTSSLTTTITTTIPTTTTTTTIRLYQDLGNKRPPAQKLRNITHSH